MHIFKVKLPFYPPCEVKCGLQNEVSKKPRLALHMELADTTSSSSIISPFSSSSSNTAPAPKVSV